MAKKRKKELPFSEELLTEEEHNANQRDLGSDEFDDNPQINDDDRIRGAGRQSLEEMAFEGYGVWGLEEGGGGIKFDQPELETEEERRTA